MTSLRLAIASDDLGFERKEELRDYLINSKGAEIVFDPVHSPEDGRNTFARIADDMARAIQEDICRLGVYVCGTGIGFTCQANKHWGIRAVTVSDAYTAKRARLSNNAQIIGLGCRVLALPAMELVVDAWLDEPFDFATARANSKRNLLEARASDDRLLSKPDYVRWNMGFEPEEQ